MVVGGDRPAGAKQVRSKLCPHHTEGARKVIRRKNGLKRALALVHAVMRDWRGVVVGRVFEVVNNDSDGLGVERSCFGSFDVPEQRKPQGHEADEHAELAVPPPALLKGTSKRARVHGQVGPYAPPLWRYRNS